MKQSTYLYCLVFFLFVLTSCQSFSKENYLYDGKNLYNICELVTADTFFKVYQPTKEEQYVDSLLEEKEYLMALSFYRDQFEDTSSLYALNQSIVANLNLKNHEIALKQLEKWDRIYKATKRDNNLLLTKHYFAFGDYYFRNRNSSKAIFYFEKAIKFGEGSFGVDLKHMALCYDRLGIIYRYRLKDPMKAERCFLKTLTIVEAEEIEKLKWRCYYNLATTYRVKQQYERGILFGRKALVALNGELKSLNGIKTSLMLGNLYGDDENYEEAINYYEKAIQTISQTGLNRRNLFRYYLQKGFYLSRGGAYEEANDFIRKGMNLIEKGDNESWLEGYRNLALNFATQMKGDSAEHYYKLALNLSQQNDLGLSIAYYDYAWALQLNSKYDLALEYINRSIANSMGTLYSIKDEPIYSDQFRLREISSEFLIAKGDILKDLYLEKNKDSIYLYNAYKVFLLADTLMSFEIREIEESASLHDLAHFHDNYGKAAECAALLFDITGHEEYLRKASQFMDRSRAVNLVSDLTLAKLAEEKIIPDSLFQRIQILKSKFEKGKIEIEEIEDIHKKNEQNEEILKLLAASDLLHSRIDSFIPESFKAKYANLQVDNQNIRKKLDEDKAQILQFHFTDDLLQCIFINRDTIVYKVNREVDSLLWKINVYLEKISTPLNMDTELTSFKIIADLGYQLYTDLVNPFAAFLSKEDRFIIITDGLLQQLPFEALIQKKYNIQDQVNYKALDYLVKHFSFQYFFSLKSYLYPDVERGRDIDQILAFSYSDDRTQQVIAHQRTLLSGLAELPFSQKEIAGIKSIYDHSDLYCFEGLDASKDNFLLHIHNSDIIHLALHAEASGASPYKNKIIFRTGNGIEEDNALYAHEIFEIQTDAALVVLSACQTGIGKRYKGEGIYSLGRSFFSRGVPSIVMSLWSIDDRSSAEIMTQFHKGLDKGVQIDQSLQGAKRKYIDQSDELLAHPYFWAAFVHLGDHTAFANRKYSYRIYFFGLLLGMLLLLLGKFSFNKINSLYE